MQGTAPICPLHLLFNTLMEDVMYTTTNYKTKKALKEAVKAGVRVTIYQPSGDITGVEAPRNGTVYLEGPHYPKSHTWYAQAEIKDGIIVRVRQS